MKYGNVVVSLKCRESLGLSGVKNIKKVCSITDDNNKYEITLRGVIGEDTKQNKGSELYGLYQIHKNDRTIDVYGGFGAKQQEIEDK